jgi:hypothetical protein
MRTIAADPKRPGVKIGFTCDSAPNRDPFDFLSHPSDFLRKSQIWRGPDRRR